MIVRLVRHILADLVRTRFVVIYFFLLLAVSLTLFNMEADAGKVMVSLLNIVLMINPLVSIVYATIHFHNSYDFITLMATQPLKRSTVFSAEFVAVSLSLWLSFFLGVGIPMVLFQSLSAGWPLLISGLLLTSVFVSLAFFASVLTSDKARAIGLALLFWFWFSILYDGFLVILLFVLSDYPMESLTIGLVALNPIDLARIMVLLTLDYSALMGYTSALYRDFFGSWAGTGFSLTILVVWTAVPFFSSLRVFRRKDL